MTTDDHSTETFFPAIWNILHDGVIVAVDGTLPGDLRIAVEIDYLRKRIPDPGTLIQVLLIGCTRFAFREYEKKRIFDLDDRYRGDETRDCECLHEGWDLRNRLY